MLEKIDYNPGEIGYINPYKIDFSKSIEEQEPLSLCEDICGIDYPDQYWIEIDWMPALDIENGSFSIVAGKGNIENILFDKETRDVQKLLEYVKEAHEFIVAELAKSK